MKSSMDINGFLELLVTFGTGAKGHTQRDVLSIHYFCRNFLIIALQINTKRAPFHPSTFVAFVFACIVHKNNNL